MIKTVRTHGIKSKFLFGLIALSFIVAPAIMCVSNDFAEEELLGSDRMLEALNKEPGADARTILHNVMNGMR